MTNSELLAHINEIRKRRVAAPALAKAAGKKTAKSAEEKTLALLKSLPPEIKAQLLKDMT